MDLETMMNMYQSKITSEVSMSKKYAEDIINAYSDYESNKEGINFEEKIKNVIKKSRPFFCTKSNRTRFKELCGILKDLKPFKIMYTLITEFENKNIEWKIQDILDLHKQIVDIYDFNSYGNKTDFSNNHNGLYGNIKHYFKNENVSRIVLKSIEKLYVNDYIDYLNNGNIQTNNCFDFFKSNFYEISINKNNTLNIDNFSEEKLDEFLQLYFEKKYLIKDSNRGEYIFDKLACRKYEENYKCVKNIKKYLNDINKKTWDEIYNSKNKKFLKDKIEFEKKYYCYNGNSYYYNGNDAYIEDSELDIEEINENSDLKKTSNKMECINKDFDETLIKNNSMTKSTH